MGKRGLTINRTKLVRERKINKSCKPASVGNPGYKHTPLGWIPDDWGIFDFRDFIVFPSKQVDPKLEPYRTRILVAPNHIESATGRLLYTESAEEQGAISGKYTFDKGDVIYTKIRPYLRKVYLAEFDGICSADMYPLKTRPGFDPRLLLYILLSERFTHFANAQSARTGFPKINREEISEYAHALPLRVSEQQSIAATLNTWDTAISRTHQLIAEKEQRRKALMQQLLTGKKRLAGFRDTWKKYPYGKLVQKVTRPVTFDDNVLYELISVRRNSRGLFKRESRYGHQIRTKNLLTAKAGDFLFSKMQILHGASGLTTPEFDGMKISGSYIAVVPRNNSALDIEFLDWFSKTPRFYYQTFVSSYGVAIEKMTFDFDYFLEQEIAIPGIPTQKAIVSVLNQATKEVELLSQKLNALQEQKRGLMQKLLTGQIRVKPT